MTSPGGFEWGRVSVRVLPDTSKFGPELKKYLERVEKTLKVQLPTVLDTRGLAAEARRAAQMAERSARVEIPTDIDTVATKAMFERLRHDLSGHSISLGVNIDRAQLQSVSAEILKFGASLSAAGLGALAGTAAAGGLLAVAGAVSQVVGALAVLPAVGAAGVVALGALVIGFEGVGDAIKNADDPKKFAEALKALSPEAREAALAFKALGPQVESFRKSIQDALFKDVAETITGLAKTQLPLLRSGFRETAEQINAMGQEFAKFLNSPQAMADTGLIFQNINLAFKELRPAAALFAEALQDIVAVGSDFLPGFAQGLTEGAERFRDFIKEARESGKLKEFITNGLSVLGDLLTILGNVGRAIGNIFKAGRDTGGGFLQILKDVTESFANFTGSVEGQEALHSFFDAAAQAAKALLPILQTAFGIFANQIAPILAEIGTIIGPSVTILLESIGRALEVARPGIEAFAKGFATFLEALAPAMPHLGNLAKVLGEQLGRALERLGPVLEPVISLLADTLADVLPIIVPAMVDFVTVLAEILPIIAPLLPPLFRLGAEILTTLADILRVLAPLLEPLIKLLIPLLELLVFIVDLIGKAIIGLGKMVEIGMAQLDGSLGAQKSFHQNSVSEFQKWRAEMEGQFSQLGVGLDALVGGFSRAGIAIKDELVEAAGSATTYQLETDAAFKATVQSTADGVAGMLEELLFGEREAGRIGLATGLGYTAGEQIGFASAEAAAHAAVLRVLTPLDAAAQQAVQAGLALATGFAQGITAGQAAISRAAAAAMAAAARFMPSSPAKEGPFSGKGWTPFRGQALAEGLADGMVSRVSAVRAAAAALTTAASGSLTVSGTGGAGAGAQTTFNLYQQPNQDPASVAAEVDRRLAFQGRLT
jgi:phage-related protein